MIASLVGIAIICGLVAPLLASVLFVLLATGAITVAVVCFSVAYGTGFWAACLAWLSAAAGLQLGYVLSLAALALRRRATGAASGNMQDTGEPRRREPTWQAGNTKVEPGRTAKDSSSRAT